jgi:protein-arginine kinase activator protein McsA
MVESEVMKVCEKCPENLSTNSQSEQSEFSWLLQRLIESSQKTVKGSHGNRYDEDLVNTACYLYILCGKAAYSILYLNLPIPCEKAVQNKIKSKFDSYIEGM